MDPTEIQQCSAVWGWLWDPRCQLTAEYLYQGCGPQADSTSSPPAADALCTAGVDHGKLHELYSLHILCLNLETLPISYSQVDGFHKTDLG